MLALAVPVLLMSRDDFAQRQFHILLLSSLYGVCLLLSADSFLTLFLGLELMSLPVYALVLLAFRRPESAEAALKYLVLGGTATAMLLMGVSLLYGGSGSLAISAFAAALGSADTMAQRGRRAGDRRLLPQGGDRAVPRLGAGRLRRRAAVPVTAYMATIIKAGVLLAAVRLFGTATVSATDGRPARDPAAGLDRLGQPGGDAADRASAA